MRHQATRILAALVVAPAMLAQPMLAAAQQSGAPAARPPARFPLLTSCDPIIPPRNSPAFSEDAATLRRNAIDILTETMLVDNEWPQTLARAEGDIRIVEGSIRSGDVFVRTPVRHAEVGRVIGDVVAVPVFRERFVVLPAGTEVWKTYHAVEYQCRRNDVQLWCGRRERTPQAVRPELQCFMPPQSDWLGIAEVRGNMYYPWGFVKFVEEAHDEGVAPLHAIEAPPMEIRVMFDGWRGQTLNWRTCVWVEGQADREATGINHVIDVREDPRGAVVSIWGGELLVTRGVDRNTATVEVLSPIPAFDRDFNARRMRERATELVDAELAKQAERDARRRR